MVRIYADFDFYIKLRQIHVLQQIHLDETQRC